MPLLESALNKMRAASNNTLVHKTLHPPGIPRKSSSTPVKAASSSASSADRGGTSAVIAEAGPDGLFLFHSPTGSKAEGAQGKGALFDCLWPLRRQARGCQEAVVLTGSLVRCKWEAVCQHTGRQAIGAESWVLSVLWDGYRIPFVDSSSSPCSYPDIISNVSVRISTFAASGPGDREDIGQGWLGDRPQSGSRLLQSSFILWNRRQGAGVS